MRLTQLALFAALPILFACGGADTSNSDMSTSEEWLANPADIAIGFNIGGATAVDLDHPKAPTQFTYYPLFKKLGTHDNAGHCHTYVRWDFDHWNKKNAAAANANGMKKYMADWFNRARGVCDDVLLSIKAGGEKPEKPLEPGEFEKSFRALVAFADDHFKSGSIYYSVWNEPNNGAVDGSGLLNKTGIPAEMAAEYLLTAAEVCRETGKCNDNHLVAGDLASNGELWHAMSWNCADDFVAPSELCKKQSDVGTGNASYLDRYKNYIANYAHGEETPAGEGHRHHQLGGWYPKIFGYHGWHDVNEFIRGKPCDTYENCATKRLLTSLGHTKQHPHDGWDKVEIWDTEVGAGQSGSGFPRVKTDKEEAEAAAFLLRISGSSKLITRIYYTRLHGDQGQLFTAKPDDAAHDGPIAAGARQAACVLALRQTTYSKSVKCTAPDEPSSAIEQAVASTIERPASGDDDGGLGDDGGTCTHDVCTAGAALGQTCNACTLAVCAHDPYCCDAENGLWGPSCFPDVQTYCGQTCP